MVLHCSVVSCLTIRGILTRQQPPAPIGMTLSLPSSSKEKLAVTLTLVAEISLQLLSVNVMLRRQDSADP